ncbi:MAG: RNA 2',3'-cyclic phosphodiesterase [Candidatus Omnitrophota bacterium]
MRAFIAIELPASIKDALSKIQDELKAVLPKVNWVKPQNLHLTLKFLGEISPGQLDAIKHIITEVSQGTAVFKIKLDDLGVFPDLRQARTIWIGINQDTIAKQIAGLLETKVAGIGIAKEKREFSSHITIGRIKIPLNPVDLERELKKAKNDVVYANMEFNTGGITLFKSVLGPAGAAYTVLKEANFTIT